jgi:hypothetical protein
MHIHRETRELARTPVKTHMLAVRTAADILERVSEFVEYERRRPLKRWWNRAKGVFVWGPPTFVTGTVPPAGPRKGR